MAVPDDVAAAGIKRTELPCTFVTNLIAKGVIPGIEEWIGGSFYLLMRGHIDGLVSIIVIGARARITSEAGGIRHCCVERIAAEVAMIRTKVVGGALCLGAINTDVLTFLCKHKEYLACAGTPSICA